MAGASTAGREINGSKGSSLPEEFSHKPSAREGSTSAYRTRIIYLIAFLDLFAASMLTPLLRQRILDSGIGYTSAGFIGSVYAFCQLFSSPILGAWYVIMWLS